MDLSFRAIHPWAALPQRPHVDVAAARERAALLSDHFRWLRAARRAELCRPWRMARELGWLVPSPIDVRLTPVDDLEIDAPDADLPTIAALSGRADLWRREHSCLALSRTDWLRLHQFRAGDRWESMFVPNGEGTVEWRLGWEVDIPARTYLLVLGADHVPAADLEVPPGLLDHATVARLGRGPGMSIAVRPLRPLALRRGDPIARLLLLDRLTVEGRFPIARRGVPNEPDPESEPDPDFHSNSEPDPRPHPGSDPSRPKG